MKTKLKKIREEKGFTQVELADKANIAIRTYQNYEAGTRIPNVNNALLICRALNATPEEVFGLSGYQSENEIRSSTV